MGVHILALAVEFFAPLDSPLQRLVQRLLDDRLKFTHDALSHLRANTREYMPNLLTDFLQLPACASVSPIR